MTSSKTYYVDFQTKRDGRTHLEVYCVTVQPCALVIDKGKHYTEVLMYKVGEHKGGVEDYYKTSTKFNKAISGYHPDTDKHWDYEAVVKPLKKQNTDGKMTYNHTVECDMPRTVMDMKSGRHLVRLDSVTDHFKIRIPL